MLSIIGNKNNETFKNNVDRKLERNTTKILKMRLFPLKQLTSFILGFLTAYIMITYLWVCKGGCQLEENGSSSEKSIELKLLSERTVDIKSSQTELSPLPQRSITLNIKSGEKQETKVESELKQSECKLTRSYPFSEENEFVDIYSLENPPQEDNPQFWEKAQHYNVDDYGKIMIILLWRTYNLAKCL